MDLSNKNKINFRSIDYKIAIDFLLPRHYSGRKPMIKYAFGAYYNEDIIAVCTYGIPASRMLCIHSVGKNNSDKVIELNRLCVIDNAPKKFILSQFVSYTLRTLPKIYCIVSYADTAMNHVGKIYQACNFIYTGMTKERTEKYSDGHSRHYKQDEVRRQIRSSKHRYFFFTDKKLRKLLKYEQLPYPIGQSSRYVLGEFLQKTIIYPNYK